MVQPAGQCLGTLDGGRQLSVVSGQDDSVGLPDGNPAGCLHSLGRFIDEECTEAAACEQTVGAACQRAGNDACFGEETLVDLIFQFRGAFLETGNLLMTRLVVARGIVIQLAYRAAYAPQLGIRRVGLETSFVGVGEHAVGDADGVADTQHAYPSVGQLLGNPINGHVTLGADEHLHLAPQRFIDCLDQCCGLSRAGRTVNDGHVLGPQDLVYRCLLRGVEPGEAHGKEGELAGRGRAVDDVAQFGQAVSLGRKHTIQRLEHQAVGVFIKV